MKYTKQQAVEYLRHSKIYVNGKSEEIQKKLFECGFTWIVGKEIQYTYKPFLLIDYDNNIKHEDNMNRYIESENKEITAGQILNIEIIEEPKLFKPFDKVLVRDRDDKYWIPGHFSHYNNEKHTYKTIGGGGWYQCIPYEGNEHLCNTNNKPE